ncbi:hypothetical protein LUD75_13440 [Epilithonimonas sp. JDS]|uniref:hypothetical protein n=1 Tax=Epilithonimonas sp. JDS TaxID=2902797 RepID=UPI001E4B52FB|nr:hypothetical protein [Epilithonimonas sp. JDS]MCD9855721.1 hypothetical protein [Epilithonimonas sp. JDS]
MINRNDFLKEWYYKEEERRNNIDNSLNIPIGILTALVAGIYYLLSKYNYLEGNLVLKCIFIIFILLTISFWIVSIYYVLLSYNKMYSGFDFKAFPCANFIKNEYDKLKIYYDENKDDFSPEITLEILVENNVEEILSECVENNVNNNDAKAYFLYKSKIHLINCIISIFATIIFFSINYIQHEKEDIYKIEIMSRNVPPPPRPQPPKVVKQSEPPRANPPAPRQPSTPPSPPRR